MRHIYPDPVIHEKSQGLTSLYDIKVKIKRIIDGQSIIRCRLIHKFEI